MTVPDPSPPVEVRGLTLPALHQKLMREGACHFREIKIGIAFEKDFRAAWSKQKRDWLARGFSLRLLNGSWILQQWLLVTPAGYALTQVGREKLAEINNPRQADMRLVSAPPVRQIVLPDLPSAIEAKLRGYQIEPTKQIYRALMRGREEWGYPGACDLSDMGTGKTYMDLGAAIATGRDPAILCPTVGAAGWQRACDHFGITPHFISTYEAVRGGFRNHIATLDATGNFTWKNPNEIVLILDEAQALRHDDTLTVRCCSAAIRQGVPIIVASATIAISPLEFRFAGRVTGLHGGGDDWARWLMQHGCFKKGQTFKWDGKPHHLQRIHSQLFPWRGARVRKQDLGDECTETVISTLPMHIPEAARIEQEWKDTEEMLERLAKQVGGAKLQIMEQRAHMKMWQRCELAIVPYLAERIKKDVKEGKSVAVFTNFDKSRIALSRLLNTNAGFYGGQSLAKRQYWEREFQADRQHILINNIGAGGASVSLHDVNGWRSRVAYILPTDHVIKMEQATGRVDRFGGKSTSEQYIPYVAGSMTEKMIARTRRKMARIAIINDGANAVASRF